MKILEIEKIDHPVRNYVMPTPGPGCPEPDDNPCNITGGDIDDKIDVRSRADSSSDR